MKTFKQFVTEDINTAFQTIFNRIQTIGDEKIIKGGVDIHGMNLRELPDLSDVNIHGNFDCGMNPHLKSLKGGPKTVSGDYSCDVCDLTDLEGAPIYIGGYFSAENNPNLKSLKGAPEYVFRFKSDKFKTADWKRYIEAQKMRKELNPETEELFGGLINEL